MRPIDWLAKRLGYIPNNGRRAYSGAQISRLTSSWNTTPKASDADIRAGLRALRTRSREQYQNNDYVKKFITMVKSNVIGSTGIVLQARSIGRGGELDVPANIAIEDAWRLWGGRGIPELSGTKTFWDLQREFISSVAMDGEALYEKVPGADNAFGFALNALDPELLDVDYNKDLGNGHYIVMGIELNGSRRPMRYHVRTSKPTVDDMSSFNGRTYRPVEADRIIHRHIADFVWQTRGVPWCSTALLRLNMLGGYEEAALVGARLAASSMGFIEPGTTGQGFTGDGEQDSDGDYLMDAEPGAFRNLPAGAKLATWDPDHPQAQYAEFVKASLRGIASGLGVSYNALANDLEGVNFSSIRAGVLEEREIWKSLQRWMIDHFMNPVYQDWLRMSLTTGAIQVNGMPLKLEREAKFQRVYWQPRRWAWVDPAKDEQAAILAINARTRSISSVIREKGEDPDDVWKELESDIAKLEAMGISQVLEAPKPEPVVEKGDDDMKALIAAIATKDPSSVNVGKHNVKVTMPVQHIEEKIDVLANAFELDKLNRMELIEIEEHRREEKKKQDNQILDFLSKEGPKSIQKFVSEVRAES